MTLDEALKRIEELEQELAAAEGEVSWLEEQAEAIADTDDYGEGEIHSLKGAIRDLTDLVERLIGLGPDETLPRSVDPVLVLRHAKGLL